MARTVVGLMDTPMSGQDLIQALSGAGIDRKDIRMLMVDRQHGRYSWKHADKSTGGDTGDAMEDLRNIGVPEDHAHYYLEGVRRGGLLVTVRTDDASAERAADIMHRKGAIDIDARAARWKETGWTRHEERAAPYSEAEIARERELHAAGAAGRGRETVLPVVEEEIRIGKREVESGGVRVYSHVVERPVEEEVTLREERAKVERTAVDRPVSGAEAEGAFREQTVEVRETSEEPVVSKQARVKEEVRVSKEAAERTETVRGKARKTEVEVDERGRRRPGLGR